MKSVQKVAPTVFQYKCKDCGLLLNYDAASEVSRDKSSVGQNQRLLMPRKSGLIGEYRKFLERWHKKEEISV